MGFVKVLAKAARRPRSRLRPLVEPGRLLNVEFGLDPGPRAAVPARRQRAARSPGRGRDPRAQRLPAGGPRAGRPLPAGRGGARPGRRGAPVRHLRGIPGGVIVGDLPPARRALLRARVAAAGTARHGAPGRCSAPAAGRTPRRRRRRLRLVPVRPKGAWSAAAAPPAARPPGPGPWARATLDLLRRLGDGSLAGAVLPEVEPATRREAGILLHRFLGYHLPGYRLPAALDLLRAAKGPTARMMTYQEMIAGLQKFWSDYGCVIVQPYNCEVGAGTFNPNTFLRALGPEPWRVAYVEPSKRPKDGRYLENPNRVHQFLQYQVILKPNPAQQPGALPGVPARHRHRAPRSTTSASSRTTGSRPPSARPAWAGRSGSTAWRSPSSPTSSRWAGCAASRSRWS